MNVDPLHEVVSLFLSDSSESEESDESDGPPELPPMRTLANVSRGAAYKALCHPNNDAAAIEDVPLAYLVVFDGIDQRRQRGTQSTRSSVWTGPVMVQYYVKYRQRGRGSPYDMEAVVVSCVKQTLPKSVWSCVVWEAKTGAKSIPICQVQPDAKQAKCTGADWVLASAAGAKVLKQLAAKVRGILKKSTSELTKTPAITKRCPNGHVLKSTKHEEMHHCDHCFTQAGNHVPVVFYV